MLCKMKRINDTGRWASLSPRIIIIYVFILVLPETTLGSAYDCGDYYGLSSSQNGSIYSPNFPNDYPEYSKCLWIVGAPSSSYRVRLILTFTGTRYNGNCADYVEVREGSQYAALIGLYCDTHTAEVITSDTPYMSVFFKSDGQNDTVTTMQAILSAYYNGTAASNTSEPIEKCRSYEFECQNSICLSMSYRCDGYNDCGCTHDCDEDGCGDLNLSLMEQRLISVGVGIFAFILVCMVSYFIERRSTWKSSNPELQAKEIQIEAQRKRASRAFSKFIGAHSGTGTNTPVPATKTDITVSEYA